MKEDVFFWNLCYYKKMLVQDKERIQTIINQCFWGDYRLDPEMVLKKISNNDEAFIRFFMARVISDSSSPVSSLLNLFTEETIKTYVDTLHLSGRAEKRRTLAKAVIFKEKWVEEPSWIRT